MGDVKHSIFVCMALLAVSCGGRNTEPQAEEPGADRTAKTATLETGANLLQSKAPIEKISMYLNGFHAAKDDPPHLAWSFNFDGEAMPGLVEDRDRRMDLNSMDERGDRKDLVPPARPQGGVAAMAGRFPNANPPLPGIQDNGDTSTRAVPRTTLGLMEPSAR